MRGFQFEIMGATRSTWDFYRGYQFSITVTFVLIAVLLWRLSSMTRTAPREARPLVVTFLITQLFYVLISWEFFFAGPGVVGGIIGRMHGGGRYRSLSFRSAATGYWAISQCLVNTWSNYFGKEGASNG
jgi:hypothetical protein